MAELGLPGLLALAVLIGSLLGGLAVRIRGPSRSLYGVMLAAGVIWTVHAGVDWDWEMPVITLPFFAVAGLALSPGEHLKASWSPGNRNRALLALPCLAALVLPVLVIGSQSRLRVAERALYATNCTRASSAARSSSGWLSARPEPYEILGFCDLRRGRADLAVMEMHRALKRDPESWERYYTLAIAQGAAGIDPRSATLRALRLNPLEPLARQAARAFRGSSRARWASGARAVSEAALASNDLSIVPS
jgi:hypothetical protein